MFRAGRDDGAMRVKTLTSLVVMLGVVGLFGYDGFSVMSNNVQTENDAQDAAYAASQAWHNDGNLQQAYLAAVQALAGKGDTVLQTGFTVDPDGTIHLLVSHTAKTIIFNHIGPLRSATVTTQHGDANSVN